jgi:transposase InsO family protein
MTQPNKNQPPQNLQALTRFKVLNFVEDLRRAGHHLADALRQAALRPWPEDDGKIYAPRTIQDWWYAYQKDGFAALQDRPRCDAGSSRVLDDATAAWIVEQVTQTPAIAVSVLYRQWIKGGRRLPSRSVIYRFLLRQGLDRKSLRAGRLESGPTKMFEAPAVNDLWMVDFAQGPTLSVDGKSMQTHLCVLIDDHSRLIPFAAYYPHAKTEAFHHCLKEAVLRRGLPRKLYTDQGKPFVNGHSRLVCAQLGIRLLHCKPYHAWSKGKCERVILSLQQGFESLLQLKDHAARDLADLNAKLSAWIQTDYHQRLHSSTGVSPQARYQAAAAQLRYPQPGVDLEPLFYLRVDRTVRKSGVVRLGSVFYEVPLNLRGLRIQLRFDPWKRTRVEVWHYGKFVSLARPVRVHLNFQTSAH